MADNPQETIRELRVLVVEYAKQETVEPLKGLGKFVGFGLVAALLIGFGLTFMFLGLLRVLQEEVLPHWNSDWSWVPYILVVVAMIIVAAIFILVGRAAMRRSMKRRSA